MSNLSKVLKGPNTNYSTFLLEMAGTAKVNEALHLYLYGVRTFTLMSDHKPLERLGTVQKHTLLKVQELILEFN